MMDRACYSMPIWFKREGENIPNLADQVRYTELLAGINVQQGTGGLFGAAIFRRGDGALISAGVDRVERLDCSLMHAEILAIMLAQKKLRLGDLSGEDLRIVISSRPCTMCYGAIVLSGIKEIVYISEDSRLEYDAGGLPSDWRGELKLRGIEISGPFVARLEARSSLMICLECNAFSKICQGIDHGTI